MATFHPHRRAKHQSVPKLPDPAIDEALRARRKAEHQERLRLDQERRARAKDRAAHRAMLRERERRRRDKLLEKRLEITAKGISMMPRIQDGRAVGFWLHMEAPSVDANIVASERELSDWLRNVLLEAERAGRDADGYYNLPGGLRVRELAGVGCGMDKSLRVLTPEERVTPGFVYLAQSRS
jgi:hypothetical protein